MGGPRERGENDSMGNVMKEKSVGDVDAGKFMGAVKVELRGGKK